MKVSFFFSYSFTDCYYYYTTYFIIKMFTLPFIISVSVIFVGYLSTHWEVQLEPEVGSVTLFVLL